MCPSKVIECKGPGDNSPCDRCHDVEGWKAVLPLSNDSCHGGCTSAVGCNPGRGSLCEYVVRVTVDHGPCAAALSPPVDTPCNNVSNNGSSLTMASDDPSVVTPVVTVDDFVVCPMADSD